MSMSNLWVGHAPFHYRPINVGEMSVYILSKTEQIFANDPRKPISQRHNFSIIHKSHNWKTHPVLKRTKPLFVILFFLFFSFFHKPARSGTIVSSELFRRAIYLFSIHFFKCNTGICDKITDFVISAYLNII